MFSACQKIKEKMREFTRLFSLETNNFKKLTIIYHYINFLNRDPVAKQMLQKIFDETAEKMGEPEKEFDKDGFLSVDSEVIHSRDFWNYYSNLELIHQKMEKIKKCRIEDKKEYEDLNKLFSKPYSAEMLKLSFKVVNSNVFDKLDQESFINGEKEKKEGKTEFDEKKGVLYVRGKKVKINKRRNETNNHKILKYIFITNKDDLKDDFFYSEIAEDEFGDREYKNEKNGWRKYHNACTQINKKVKDQAGVKNFLIHTTGRKGKVKINPDFL
jgi:hypothetical protein